MTQESGPEIDLHAFLRAFATELKSRVQRRTPVITGTLRAGWETSVRQDVVEISNEVPYAGYVEFGTTKMAPRGMLRTTIDEIPQIIEQVKRTLIK